MIWPLIITSYLSLFVFGITDNTRGPLFPEILKAFAVSDSKGALLFSLSSIAGFLMSFIAIYLLKRHGRKRILEISCLFMSGALVGLSMAPSFNQFIFFSILFGMTSSMLGLLPNILVPIGSSIQKRQQLISGLHAMYGIASLCSPLVVTVVYKFIPSWRACFLTIAFFPILLFLYIRNIDAELFNKNKSVVDQTKKKFKLNLNKKLLIQLFLALSLSFTVMGEVMMSSRLALFMRRVYQMDLAASSLYVTYFFTAMLIGRTLFALKKFKQEIPFQLFFLGVFAVISLICGIEIHPIGFVFAGFFISPYYPLMASYIAEQFPKELDQAMGMMVGVDSVMLALMHIFIGRLTDLNGIAYALKFGSSFILISVLLVNIYRFKFANKFIE